MSETRNPSAEAETIAVPSDAPNWNHVPFDVACARCGHDLRGLTDPICPACELEFDWADAVPIERLTCLHCGYHLFGLKSTRCPECGSDFTWNEVLAEYHRRRSRLFEYRWRDKPIRSFVSSFFCALRPRKLWADADIQAQVPVRPLLNFVAIGLFLMFTELVLFSAAVQFGFEWRAFYQGWAARPAWWGFVTLVVSWLGRADLWLVLVSTLSWFAAVLGSLLIFPQSMRRCRIRCSQVLRVWAYAVPVVPMICVAVFFGIVGWNTIAMLRFGLDPPIAIFFLAVVLHSTRSIQVGFRDYLKIPHAAGVACSSQLIALLAATACDYYVTMPLFGRGFFFGAVVQVTQWLDL